MAQSFDVLVRGGGVVGLTTALLLAQARLRVALLDASVPRNGPDVRAYALNAASRGLLQSLRAWPAGAACTPVLQMRVWGDEGGAVDFAADRMGCEALAWIVDVPALEAALAGALHYQPQIERVDQVPPAQLTVVCEGKASASRAGHAIEFEAIRYPQHALSARLVGSVPHGQVARQWFVAGPEGAEIIALLPMGDAQVSLVWSAPAARAAQLQALEPAAFEDALRAACSQRPETDPGALTLASARAVWPLQLASASRWVEAGFALVGDAAHTVHPLSGQGLNLGLADAAALAQVLGERDYWRSPGDLRLLRRYERMRKAGLARTSLVTDGLERLFSHTDGRVQALRNWGMQGFNRIGPLRDWVARQAMGV